MKKELLQIEKEMKEQEKKASSVTMKEYCNELLNLPLTDELKKQLQDALEKTNEKYLNVDLENIADISTKTRYELDELDLFHIAEDCELYIALIKHFEQDSEFIKTHFEEIKKRYDIFFIDWFFRGHKAENFADFENICIKKGFRK